MITKVYFPRVLIPLAAVAVRLSDFLVASLILLALIIYYGIHPTGGLLMALLLIGHLSLIAAGIGIYFSALYVKYRDVGTVVPVLLQICMFISPIIYPVSLVPSRWRVLYNLNPLAGVIDNFRACLFGLPRSYGSLISSAAVTLVLLVYSAYIFRRMEDEFADIV